MQDPNNPQEGETVNYISVINRVIPNHVANDYLNEGYAIMPYAQNRREKLALFTVKPGTPDQRFYITIDGVVSLVDTPAEETMKNDISFSKLFTLAKIVGREYPAD